MQDDFNKMGKREEKRGGGYICGSCGIQLGIQGPGLFSVDSISVSGAGPEKGP